MQHAQACGLAEPPVRTHASRRHMPTSKVLPRAGGGTGPRPHTNPLTQRALPSRHQCRPPPAAQSAPPLQTGPAPTAPAEPPPPCLRHIRGRTEAPLACNAHSRSAGAGRAATEEPGSTWGHAQLAGGRVRHTHSWHRRCLAAGPGAAPVSAGSRRRSASSPSGWKAPSREDSVSSAQRDHSGTG